MARVPVWAVGLGWMTVMEVTVLTLPSGRVVVLLRVDVNDDVGEVVDVAAAVIVGEDGEDVPEEEEEEEEDEDEDEGEVVNVV